MRLLGIGLVVAALVLGAGSPAAADPSPRWTSSKVCVDARVPARWGVSAAIRQWNRGAGPDFYRSTACTGPTVTIRLGHLSGAAVGMTWVSHVGSTIVGARLVLDPSKVHRYDHRRCLRHHVAAHELGHALGLRHAAGQRLMSPTKWKPMCGRPTGADYGALAALY